jgi:predicted permease
MGIFLSILLNSIIPIFILLILGFIIDRRFHFDVNTLTKICLYLIMPSFMLVSIYTTDVSMDLIRVLLLNGALIIANFVVGAVASKLLKLPGKSTKAFENALMFCNSGNIGVSLMTLVFSNPPFSIGGEAPFLDLVLSVQIMTMLAQNIAVNTFGFINNGGDDMTWKKGLSRVVRMPSPYAVLAAFLLKLLPFDFTATPVWPALEFLRNGLVSVALITLGAQISQTRIDLKNKAPYLASFCRLVGGPALAFLLVKMFGFDGVIAQAILISSSTPSAVNVVMLAIESKGDVDFCVQSVTVSTLFSAVTMAMVVYMAYVLF